LWILLPDSIETISDLILLLKIDALSKEEFGKIV
jgi:hypothetical protein